MPMKRAMPQCVQYLLATWSYQLPAKQALTILGGVDRSDNA